LNACALPHWLSAIQAASCDASDDIEEPVARLIAELIYSLITWIGQAAH
jgi:hypothetical protein